MPNFFIFILLLHVLFFADLKHDTVDIILASKKP